MTIKTYTESFKCIAPIFLDKEQKQTSPDANHPQVWGRVLFGFFFAKINHKGWSYI